MAHLPFLVVHGAVIAKLLVAACGVAAAAVVLRNRRARERRQNADLVEARGGGLATTLVAGPASLRGTLTGTVTTLTENPALGDLPQSTRSDALTIDVAGTKVELRGDVTVIRGTSASAAWLGMPPGTPPALAKDVPRGRRRLFGVATGDEVIVQGTLAERAVDSPEYRESAAAWTLQPTTGLAAIELIATKPKLQPPGLDLVRLAAIVLGFTVVGYGALRGLGSSLAKTPDHSEERHSRSSLPFSLQLATALPHSREDALDHLDSMLEIDFPHDEATAQLRYETAALRRGCSASADLMIRDGRYEQAVAEARGCDERETARALVMLGRYDEAWSTIATTIHESWEHEDIAVVAAIATARWAEAAAIVDVMAEKRWTSVDSDPDTALINRTHRGRQKCIAEWFRAKAGDRDAQHRLEALATSTEATACLISLALVAPDDADRIARLEAAAKIDRRFEFGEPSFARTLLWAADQDQDDVLMDMFGVTEALLGQHMSDELWLAPWAANADRRASVLSSQAVLDVVHGDPKAALDHLAKASQTLTEHQQYYRYDLDMLSLGVKLHTSATDLVIPEGHDPMRIGEYIPLRTGSGAIHVRLDSYGCESGLQQVIAQTVSSGDGQPLADRIARCDLYFRSAPALLAIAPRITSHREEFAAALRLFGDPYIALERMPFDQILYAMERRDLARLAGDEPSATVWQGIIDRNMTMLGDRDKVVAFLFWRL